MSNPGRPVHGGWNGSGRATWWLVILPRLTHYDIFSDPALAATAIQFLDDPTTLGAS
jgi:hypothetical protein